MKVKLIGVHIMHKEYKCLGSIGQEILKKGVVHTIYILLFILLKYLFK